MLNLNKTKKVDIDLKNTQGNSFYLIKQAKILAKENGKNPDSIIREMTASNYQNMINVFKREFSNYINIVE